MFGRLYTVHDKNYAAAIYIYSAPAPYVRALDAPRDYTAKLRLECNTAKHVKKEQRQVNEKFCELKGGNIEKAQETKFGMS